MTHDPDQEPTTGGSPGRSAGTPPLTPEPTSQPSPDRDVLSGGPAGPEQGRTPVDALRARWQLQSARARALTTAATVLVLAVLGTVAYAATSGGSGDDPAATGTTSPSSAAGDRDLWRDPGPWYALGGETAHGEATIKNRDSDDWFVRVWQWGTIEKVDGDQVTVKSEDDAEWTWTVNGDAIVWHDGTSGRGVDELTEGETAYLTGSRADDGTRTASLAGTWEDDESPGDWRFTLPGRDDWYWQDSHPGDSGSTT